jgi:signal transduction histidine kinase
VDAFLTRLYERWGAWYALLIIGAALGNTILSIVVGAGALASFLHPTSGQLLEVLLVALLVGAGCLAVIFSFVFQEAMRLLRWPASRDIAAAQDVWRATARVGPRTIRIGVPVFALAFIPVTVWGARDVVHEPWSLVPAAYAIVLVAILFAATLDYFTVELLFRPVRREVAQYLPPTFQPEHHPVTLRTRLLLVIFVASLSTSIVVASAETGVDTPATRITIGVLVGLGIAASIGLLPATMLARSEGLSRRALIGAARKVEAGDLDVEIPLVAADETVTLALSFNRMVKGLAEREELRERTIALDAALKASLEEVRASRARIVAAADAERRRVERDLHDGAQQQLVLLQLKLGLLERATGDDPQVRGLIDELRGDVSRALREVRDLAHGIYPALLENEGLPGALRTAAQNAAIPADFECDGTGRYAPELEAAVYFCCLEALQNAAKHAGQDAHATVRLAQRGDALAFEVADDGRGYDAARARVGAGLQNIADRIGALGGTVEIESAPGSGTRISGTVPLT